MNPGLASKALERIQSRIRQAYLPQNPTPDAVDEVDQFGPIQEVLACVRDLPTTGRGESAARLPGKRQPDGRVVHPREPDLEQYLGMCLGDAIRAAAPGSPEHLALDAVRESLLAPLHLQRLKHQSKHRGDPPDDPAGLRSFWKVAMEEPEPVDAEVDKTRLGPPLLRMRGGNVVAQLNQPVWRLYVLLIPFYVARPRLTDGDIGEIRNPGSGGLELRRHRRHSVFPRDLVADIADLLDGEVGQPGARVTSAYVKRAIQSLVELVPQLREDFPMVPRLR
ncbi:MAG: hypothetical protein JST54_29160 [Deltaproteobacteria bacterium]|nr:hypothetical protein [Deltaproteobacteria bacterium]